MRYTIKCPYSIILGHKKYNLTLNNYRNWHYQVSNKIKKVFYMQVLKQVSALPKIDKCKIEITPVKKSKRKFDLDNCIVCSKFLLDSLCAAKVLEDDNYCHVTEVKIKPPLFKGGNYFLVDLVVD